MLVQIQNYDWCFLPPGSKAFLYRSMNTRAIACTSFILGWGSSVKEIRTTWKVGEKFFPLQSSLKSFCGKHNCVLNAKIHTDLKILIFKECCHGNPYLLSFPTLHMWGTFSSSFSPACGSFSSPSATAKNLALSPKRCQTRLLFSWKVIAKNPPWAQLERDAKTGIYSQAPEKDAWNIFQQFLLRTGGKNQQELPRWLQQFHFLVA